MLQEVQEYKNAVAAAETVYPTNPAGQRSIKDAAWTTLGTSSDDLVRYIVANANLYKTEALAVLEILPADADAIREAASAGGWNTGFFTEMLDQAITAGVISDGTEDEDEDEDTAAPAPGVARRRFLEAVHNAVGPHAVAQAEELLNDVLNEEATAHAARQASELVQD